MHLLKSGTSIMHWIRITIHGFRTAGVIGIFPERMRCSGSCPEVVLLIPSCGGSGRNLSCSTIALRMCFGFVALGSLSRVGSVSSRSFTFRREIRNSRYIPLQSRDPEFVIQPDMLHRGIGECAPQANAQGATRDTRHRHLICYRR